MIERVPEAEDIRVEFEEGWTETAKKTLIAFANTLGGDLYFGITDAGEAKGLGKKEVDRISRSVLEFCRTGTEPVMLDLVLTMIIAVGNGNYLLRVSVLPGLNRPYAFKGKRYTGGAYVRDGSMSVCATEEEIRNMIRESAPEPWESRLSRQADFSFGETADIFKKYNVGFSLAHYLRLGLVDDGGRYTQLGELLSDQNRTKLVVGTFSQDEASLAVREFSGSLVKQIDRVFDLFAELNRDSSPSEFKEIRARLLDSQRTASVSRSLTPSPRATRALPHASRRSAQPPSVSGFLRLGYCGRH